MIEIFIRLIFLIIIFIINRYNKPDPKEVKDNIVVKKSIKGDKPSEDAEFKFLLKGISSNVVGMKYIPFPQASTNLEKTISIKGSGNADFGDIAFTKPGEYTYQVSEINTGDKNYKYDDAKYEITFKVVYQDDNTLKVNKSITKNGKPTEVIEFQNEYKKPTKPITVTPAPETGDNMNITLIVAVIAVACIGLVLLTIKNKKDNK